MATPERTSKQTVIRVAPCPTHTHGHPTIVVTQFSDITPPLSQNRHQLLDSHDHFDTPQSPSGRQAHLSNSRATQRRHAQSRTSDSAFDRKLWSLVPASFRPQPSDTTSIIESLSHQQQQQQQQHRRPTAADAIYHSQDGSISPQPNADEHLGTATDSLVCRDTAGSPPRSGYTLKDNNPFEVEGPSDSSVESALPFMRRHIQYTTNAGHHSQLISAAFQGAEPQTPPALRTRCRSVDITASEYSPIRYDDSQWSTLKRKPLGFEMSSHERNSPKRRTLISTAPTDVLVRTDGFQFTAGGRSSRPSSSGSNSDSEHTVELSTPSKSANRALKEPPISPTAINSIETSTGLSSGQRSPVIRTPNGEVVTPTQPLPTRRYSFLDQDSPYDRTPPMPMSSATRRTLINDSSLGTEAVSSLADSPSLKVEWSQSLETPAKKRECKTPTSVVIQRLRGVPTALSFDDQPPPATIEGWSTSLETPPRKTSSTDNAVEEIGISESVLDKLRGMPAKSPTLQGRRRTSTPSQDGSFYSATESLVVANDDYQHQAGSNELEKRTQESVLVSGDEDAVFYRGSSHLLASSDPGLDDIGSNTFSMPAVVGMALPNSLVRELEQETDDSLSPVLLSPVIPDSQSDFFDGITSAEIYSALLSKSDEIPRHITQHEQDLKTPEDQRNLMATRIEKNAARSFEGFRSASGKVAFKVSNERLQAASRLFDEPAGVTPEHQDRADGRLHIDSQDLDTEKTHLDPWSLPVPGKDAIRATNNEEDQNTQQRSQSREYQTPNDVNSDDDFADVRFSQLDDDFTRVPDSTPKTRRSQNTIKAEELSSVKDVDNWLSTSAVMFGNEPELEYPGDQTSRHVEPPSFAGGGFSFASGKKLAPPSKATLARIANLFEGDDNMDEVSMARDCQDNPDLPRAFEGFQSAGGKALPPVSKAARDRAELFLQDDNAPDSGQNSVNRHLVAPISSGSVAFAQPHPPLEFGGFASGSGRKLAPVAKEQLEKWSKQFAQDEDSYTAHQNAREPIRAPPSAPSSAPPPGINQFGGFASGSGRALAPISKAAQARALSVLEVDVPAPAASTSHVVSARSTYSGNKPLTATSIPQSFDTIANKGTAPARPPQPPTVSSHMHKLKLKSMRARSARTSYPLTGVLGPASQSKNPFKPPLMFKSPLKPDNTATGTTTDTLRHPEEGSSELDELTERVPPTKQSTFVKKPIGARRSLHPQARAIPPQQNTAVPVAAAVMTPAPSYRTLFNLKASRDRTTFRDTLGLPQRHSAYELEEIGVTPDVIEMTLNSARTYVFGSWGTSNAYSDLVTRGANKNLFSMTWVENHYGLIVWKLACYVRSWPQYFFSLDTQQSLWFSPTKVLEQLAYRYEREINQAERPALRKIVEGDEPAAKHMVLAVAAISKEYSEETKKEVMKVSVTDGWYVLTASLDASLVRAVERGKLKVGSKVHVCRAGLTGAENGVAILEAAPNYDSSSVAIVLQANYTRLARWDTRLGFQKEPLIWTTRLQNITPEGGLIPGLDVVVLRKYPIMYLETLSDGATKVRRTAKEEERAVEAYQAKLEKQYQDMVQEVEKAYLGTEEGRDPSKIQAEIQSKATEIQAVAGARNVMPFFTIRVGNYPNAGTRSNDNDYDEHGRQRQEALITFWHQGNAPYHEGQRVRITALNAKSLSREYGFEGMVQIASTRMTTVLEMPTDPEALLLTNYQPRKIVTCADVRQLYQGAEADLAVIIIAIGQRVINSNKIYFIVTDPSRHLLLVEYQLPAISISMPDETALPSFLKCHSKIMMSNVRYKMTDQKLGLDIVMSLPGYTHITAVPTIGTAPTTVTGSTNVSGTAAISGGVPSSKVTASSLLSRWPVYAQSALQNLHDLTSKSNGDKGSNSGPEGEISLLDLMTQANSILTSMQPTI
ncbi:Breast cancer 2, early onset [Haplosporangium sp. Z 767]|nr:Breast cancer 2, early onset [Haplosporangium sp. Z 11]KAF9192976.1 Breast cancer 2, early onset [Haplosporangium sp. Z 767]